MISFSLKIKHKIPKEIYPLDGRDLLPSVRALFVGEYTALKITVLTDPKMITLQEFESTFRTLFFNDPWDSFFDELMIGKMRLEA